MHRLHGGNLVRFKQTRRDSVIAVDAGKIMTLLTLSLSRVSQIKIETPQKSNFILQNIKKQTVPQGSTAQ